MADTAAVSKGQAPPSQPAGGPPDLNFQTNPFGVVLALIDETADFQMLAVPDSSKAKSSTFADGKPGDYYGINYGAGLVVDCTLHRFESVAQTPGSPHGLTVAETSAPTGSLHARWLFSPENAPWAPGHEPPPMIFDPWRSQRFTMPECTFRIGGVDGFQAYGIGRTFPVSVNGRNRVLAGGVGNLTSGFGRFEGFGGTFVLTGSIVPGVGFLGNITLRVIDFPGEFRTDEDLEIDDAIPYPAPDDTFLVMRGAKKDSHVLTTYGPPPGGNLVSISAPTQMCSARYSFKAGESRRPRTSHEYGDVIGGMDANIISDLTSPPGTPDKTVPFTTKELYTFINGNGQTVGTVTTGVVDGISFGLKFPSLPNQPGLRFAGYGPITGGTGLFAGAQGMLTVNSLIGIQPHALSLIHVLHFADSGQNFKANGR